MLGTFFVFQRTVFDDVAVTCRNYHLWSDQPVPYSLIHIPFHGLFRVLLDPIIGWVIHSWILVPMIARAPVGLYAFQFAQKFPININFLLDLDSLFCSIPVLIPVPTKSSVSRGSHSSVKRVGMGVSSWEASLLELSPDSANPMAL